MSSRTTSKSININSIYQSNNKTSHVSDNTQKFTPKKNSFAPLGNGVMPIGAWIAPPQANIYKNNPDYITNENYKILRESGLNFIIGLYERCDISPEPVLKALDYAHNNGLKYIVSDGGIIAGIDDYETMVDKLNVYKNKPSYLGTLLYDEPAIPLLSNFGLVHENFLKAVPNNLLYINLMPNYAKKNQCYKDKSDESGGSMTAAEYQHYIDSYVNLIKPKFISYDYYPCEGAFPNLKEGYFENMSVIRKAAQKINSPFWVFIQSCSFGGGTRVPIKAETFWQVNTALAYGCQGIQYFCYWMPLEYETWQGGIVSRTGQITPIYYDVQQINKQISAVDNVLMNSTSIGVMVVNDSPVPIPESDILKNYKELKSISSNLPILTGCFDYNGKAAYYVVNNSLDKTGTAILKFSMNVKTTIIQNAASSQKNGNIITLNLSAGEGVLVQIN